MKTTENNRGFTLAELLIVIAIIAALVAIMIPTFSGQIERAHEAADIANVRSACSEVAFKYLSDGVEIEKLVPVTQTKANWQTADNEGIMELENYMIAGTIKVPSAKAGDGVCYKVYWVKSANTIQVDVVTEETP